MLQTFDSIFFYPNNIILCIYIYIIYSVDLSTLGFRGSTKRLIQRDQCFPKVFKLPPTCYRGILAPHLP